MKKLLPLLSLLLLSSCGAYQLINSEVYNNADLSAYTTYRIVTEKEGELPALMRTIDYYNIATAIRQQMNIRGYVESPQSDLLVNIGLTVQTQIDTEPALPPGFMPYNGYYPYYIFPRAYYWQNYYSNAKLITDIYKEGVLSIDFVNIRTKTFLYAASVSTILQNGQAALRDNSEIDKAVQVLFSKYPVKPLVPTAPKK